MMGLKELAVVTDVLLNTRVPVPASPTIKVSLTVSVLALFTSTSPIPVPPMVSDNVAAAPLLISEAGAVSTKAFFPAWGTPLSQLVLVNQLALTPPPVQLVVAPEAGISVRQRMVRAQNSPRLSTFLMIVFLL